MSASEECLSGIRQCSDSLSFSHLRRYTPHNNYPHCFLFANLHLSCSAVSTAGSWPPLSSPSAYNTVRTINPDRTYIVRLTPHLSTLGITGGFAPPTPSAIYTITGAPSQPSWSITAAVRPDGTPSLGDEERKTLAATDATATALVGELHDILKGLPTEQPPGSEDIYGLDTGIAFGSDDLMWMNGGPAGCGGGTSTVQATEEQKVQFKRAVKIVQELVERAS